MKTFTKMSLKDSKGFTLIELLVVIAIIGILSGIVLTSLNTARTKATDAKVKSQMSAVRSAAEIAYDGSKYGVAGATANDCGTLSTHTALANLMNGNNWPDGNKPACTSNATANNNITAYSMSHVLPSSTGYACVDSTGVSTTTAVAVTGGKNCAGTVMP